MQAMIHHHGQAILMTKVGAPAHAGVTSAAGPSGCRISQETEIELIQGWLQARGVEPEARGTTGHDHGAGETCRPGC